MTNAVKVFKDVFLVLAAIIFLYGSTTCEAAPNDRVYNAGVDDFVNSLAKSGMPVTFEEKGDIDNWDDLQTTPYKYTVNFDTKIELKFMVNNSGYVNHIFIYSYDAKLTNFKKATIQVFRVLGMNDKQAANLFNKRSSENPQDHIIKVAGRTFVANGGPEGLLITARK